MYEGFFKIDYLGQLREEYIQLNLPHSRRLVRNEILYLVRKNKREEKRKFEKENPVKGFFKPEELRHQRSNKR